MHIIRESFQRLFPEKELIYNLKLKYSGKFKPYNANIKLAYNNLILNLSKEWKPVNREIKIGLIQSLMAKLFKSKKQTSNIELYNSFIKNISELAPITTSDPVLEESFKRVNANYFNNALDQPNLRWAKLSIRKLGSYEFQTDTIHISSIFKQSTSIPLDYVMYHEMLHKKHKFHTKNGRTYYHTSHFKHQEREFRGIKQAEAEIKALCRYRKPSKKPISFFKLLKKAGNKLL